MASYVVSEDFKSDSPVELTVSQNALSASGEGFTISDENGNVIFKMDGHALSIRDRCTLLDCDGNPILTARKKVKFTLHNVLFLFATSILFFVSISLYLT